MCEKNPYDWEDFLNKLEDGSAFDGPCPVNTMLPGDFDGDVLDESVNRKERKYEYYN